ncbi:MAG: carbohydrate-binding protein, partial [Actinomycetota bacterium]|nr:carbohydrate-binding protein [Actinomycetota bacterium]
MSLNFPDSSTTGVPKSVELAPSGSLTVSEDGAVVESRKITGTVTVKANDVVIRKTLIESDGLYAIKIMPGYRNLVVEDTEIDGGGVGSAAVCCSNYSLLRVDIHDVTEGPRLGSNTAVEDSYIHHLHRCDSCHIDALQTTGGTDITIRRNNLQAYNPTTGYLMNAAYQFGTTQGPVTDVLVEDNFMNGGNYTVNGGGGGTSDAAV